jgi:hypothetical protein
VPLLDVGRSMLDVSEVHGPRGGGPSIPHRGSWAAFGIGPLGSAAERFIGPPLLSPLLPRGRRGRSRRVSRGNILNSMAEVNPNGIPSLSPGLRGTSYPGCARSKESPTLKGLQPLTGNAAARQKPAPCRNPFRVEHGSGTQPRVARASQPWAGGYNPFGIGGGSLKNAASKRV